MYRTKIYIIRADNDTSFLELLELLTDLGFVNTGSKMFAIDEVCLETSDHKTTVSIAPPAGGVLSKEISNGRIPKAR